MFLLVDVGTQWNAAQKATLVMMGLLYLSVCSMITTHSASRLDSNQI